MTLSKTVSLDELSYDDLISILTREFNGTVKLMNENQKLGDRNSHFDQIIKKFSHLCQNCSSLNPEDHFCQCLDTGNESLNQLKDLSAQIERYLQEFVQTRHNSVMEMITWLSELVKNQNSVKQMIFQIALTVCLNHCLAYRDLGVRLAPRFDQVKGYNPKILVPITIQGLRLCSQDLSLSEIIAHFKSQELLLRVLLQLFQFLEVVMTAIDELSRSDSAISFMDNLADVCFKQPEFYYSAREKDKQIVFGVDQWIDVLCLYHCKLTLGNDPDIIERLLLNQSLSGSEFQQLDLVAQIEVITCDLKKKQVSLKRDLLGDQQLLALNEFPIEVPLDIKVVGNLSEISSYDLVKDVKEDLFFVMDTIISVQIFKEFINKLGGQRIVAIIRKNQLISRCEIDELAIMEYIEKQEEFSKAPKYLVEEKKLILLKLKETIIQERHILKQRQNYEEEQKAEEEGPNKIKKGGEAQVEFIVDKKYLFNPFVNKSLWKKQNGATWIYSNQLMKLLDNETDLISIKQEVFCYNPESNQITRSEVYLEEAEQDLEVWLSDPVKYNHSNEKLCYITLRIMLILAYLHKKKIIYSDLKPENFLITADMSVKIGDFGTAIYTGNQEDGEFFIKGLTQAFSSNEFYQKMKDVESIKAEEGYANDIHTLRRTLKRIVKLVKEPAMYGKSNQVKFIDMANDIMKMKETDAALFTLLNKYCTLIANDQTFYSEFVNQLLEAKNFQAILHPIKLTKFKMTYLDFHSEEYNDSSSFLQTVRERHEFNYSSEYLLINGSADEISQSSKLLIKQSNPFLPTLLKYLKRDAKFSFQLSSSSDKLFFELTYEDYQKYKTQQTQSSLEDQNTAFEQHMLTLKAAQGYSNHFKEKDSQYYKFLSENFYTMGLETLMSFDTKPCTDVAKISKDLQELTDKKRNILKEIYQQKNENYQNINSDFFKKIKEATTWLNFMVDSGRIKCEQNMNLFSKRQNLFVNSTDINKAESQKYQRMGFELNKQNTLPDLVKAFSNQFTRNLVEGSIFDIYNYYLTIELSLQESSLDNFLSLIIGKLFGSLLLKLAVMHYFGITSEMENFNIDPSIFERKSIQKVIKQLSEGSHIQVMKQRFTSSYLQFVQSQPVIQEPEYHRFQFRGISNIRLNCNYVGKVKQINNIYYETFDDFEFLLSQNTSNGLTLTELPKISSLKASYDDDFEIITRLEVTYQFLNKNGQKPQEISTIFGVHNENTKCQMIELQKNEYIQNLDVQFNSMYLEGIIIQTTKGVYSFGKIDSSKLCQEAKKDQILFALGGFHLSNMLQGMFFYTFTPQNEQQLSDLVSSRDPESIFLSIKIPKQVELSISRQPFKCCSDEVGFFTCSRCRLYQHTLSNLWQTENRTISLCNYCVRREYFGYFLPTEFQGMTFTHTQNNGVDVKIGKIGYHKKHLIAQKLQKSDFYRTLFKNPENLLPYPINPQLLERYNHPYQESAHQPTLNLGGMISGLMNPNGGLNSILNVIQSSVAGNQSNQGNILGQLLKMNQNSQKNPQQAKYVNLERSYLEQKTQMQSYAEEEKNEEDPLFLAQLAQIEANEREDEMQRQYEESLLWSDSQEEEKTRVSDDNSRSSNELIKQEEEKRAEVQELAMHRASFSGSEEDRDSKDSS